MRFLILALLAVLTFATCKTPDIHPPLSEPASAPQSAGPIEPESEQTYEAKLVNQFSVAGPDSLAVCTWNIQWIGHWKAKRNDDLAETLKNCDVAVIQEMVAPPWDVTVVERRTQTPRVLNGDPESKAFVDAMKAVGFDGVLLSPEDTGPTKNHTNATASEWYALFYKSVKVSAAPDLPSGFLARKLAGHSVYSRVPYAFALRAKREGKPSADFVLVSVHLHAKGAGESVQRSKAVRVREFRAINQWITKQRLKHQSKEQDFFVVGDMNIEDLEEVMAFFGQPAPWMEAEIASVPAASDDLEPLLPEAASRLRKVRSMNYAARSRTMIGTNLQRTKPFDHVMHHGDITLGTDPVLEILDIQKAFKLATFPNARTFVQAYSDHNPLRFVIRLSEDKD